MATRRKKPLTEEEQAERERIYRRCLDEELGKPMTWFKHDVDASQDDKIFALRWRFGWEGVGRWWLLVERLASRQGYCYTLDDELGWARFCHDMEFAGRDEAEPFVRTIVELGLCEPSAWEEERKLASDRLCGNGIEAAEAAARRRAAAEVTNAKRYG